MRSGINRNLKFVSLLPAIRILLAVAAVAIAFMAMRYLNFKIQGILLWEPANVRSTILYRLVFYLHIVFGILTLLIAILQFWPKLRARRLGLHKIMGKVYIVSVLLSATGALAIAPFAFGGTLNSLGFAAMAAAWLITTGKGWSAVMRGNFKAHGEWMTRSYAVTLSALSLRMGLIILPLWGLDFSETYSLMAWWSWIFNLLVAELYLISSKKWGRKRKTKPSTI